MLQKQRVIKEDGPGDEWKRVRSLLVLEVSPSTPYLLSTNSEITPNSSFEYSAASPLHP